MNEWISKKIKNDKLSDKLIKYSKEKCGRYKCMALMQIKNPKRRSDIKQK